MAGGLLGLIVAELAFGVSHVVLSSTRWRGALRDQLGERGFLVLYSVTALATFAWFILAYRRAPTILLWPTQHWMVLVPVLVMPWASILLISGYTTRNPTAVGMERSAAASDPAPGILRITRHPIMWAIGLWALAHMVPNGDVASLMLFGGIALLALGGTLLIDRKKRLALGSNWPVLAALTSNLPFLALLSGRARLRWRDIGLLRIVAGLLLYAVLYLGHPLLSGVKIPSL
ncbi:MAG TPA: NnrU family protein [Stellaceae bacterium]|nr:NnrU family protein [Stellaceae bacterium]